MEKVVDTVLTMEIHPKTLTKCARIFSRNPNNWISVFSIGYTAGASASKRLHVGREIIKALKEKGMQFNESGTESDGGPMEYQWSNPPRW